MRNMLVVDDEIAIRQLIKKYAVANDFGVYEASNGIDALIIIEREELDVIILDVMMPAMNGYEVCRECRKISDVPIIMLTARDSEIDKYQGFELGIDDYVVKPFLPRELMYRVDAILKRGKNIKGHTYRYKDLELDYVGHTLRIGQDKIELTPKEYELLTYFINNKNIALERNHLIVKIWGYDFEGDDRTLDTHIKRLRKKLGTYQNCIATVRGVGYRYEEN